MHPSTEPSSSGRRFGVSQWANGVRPSELQKLLTAASRPDVLSFALGLPDASLFPTSKLSEACQRAAKHQKSPYQYSPPERSLVGHIVELMSSRGVRCSPDEIFLTTGAQQGLSLLTRLLADSSKTVLVDELSYPGFLQVLLPLGVNIVSVRSDPSWGMDVVHLEEILSREKKVAFIYCMSEGHNPLTYSLSMESRRRIVELAKHYGVPLIEDDAYGFLQYDADLRKPIKSLCSDQVLYVGSFSKILAPGLRVGWIVAPQWLIPPLSILKESSDINTGTFSQRVLAEFLEENSIREHIAILCRAYRRKRDLLALELERQSNRLLKMTTPRSGLFLWATTSLDIDTSELLIRALDEEKVAFVPGAAFAANPRLSGTLGSNSLRLNFSAMPLDSIPDAVARLMSVLQKEAAASGKRS